MGIENILYLLGGLGAFLFGMTYMGEGLQLAAGSKMKDLLEKLTRNPVLGFVIGALVTVVIQSSSATTVMVMGFINASIMDLAQATGVIFGANIGTTITSILIAIDVSAIAPACIIIGAVMMLYSKKKNIKYIGQVILGFGFLFEGLHNMSGSMAPLQQSKAFQQFITSVENPFLGFLLGIIMCTILQSSSAAVGIIQTLSAQGLMPLGFAAFIVCGINIGSSAPVLISSINARNNAKRAAVIYLLFNTIGALIFIPLTIFTPLIRLLETHIGSGAFQVSLYHILFKCVTGLVLLPFVKPVVKLTYRIVPVQAHESSFRLQYIDKHMIGSPAVLMVQIEKEVGRLAQVVRDNLKAAVDGLLQGNTSTAAEVERQEELVDFLTFEIASTLSKINTEQLPRNISKFMSCSYKAINELEQIGDHAVNISRMNQKLSELKLHYSDMAAHELSVIAELVQEVYWDSVKCYENHGSKMEELMKTNRTSRKAMILCNEAQTHHLARLRNGDCTPEHGMTFLETLNSFSRILNHSTSIERGVLSSSVRAQLSQQVSEQRNITASF